MAQVAGWICHARARVNHLSANGRQTPEMRTPTAQTGCGVDTPRARKPYAPRTRPYYKANVHKISLVSKSGNV